MERGDQGERVARGGRIKRHDAGQRPTPCLDQPLILQPLQRFADRGAAHTKLLGNVLIAQPLTRLQLANDDGAQQEAVSAVAQ
jgi:hypothetical protein